MSSPLERLTNILNAHQPAVIKFRYNPANNRHKSLHFESVTIKPATTTPTEEDKQLFDLLSHRINDTWDDEQERYVVGATVDTLWRHILSEVTYRYEKISNRCDATKRKTVNFIYKIKPDDKFLAEFVLQTFLNIESDDFIKVAPNDRVKLFEQFDSLRRTFGKRI